MLTVALCQTDPTVGDLDGNVAAILSAARRAHSDGADLAVFAELAVCGYPPRDLLDRDDFVMQQLAARDRLARALPPGLATVVGFVDRRPGDVGRKLYNAVALLRGGRVEAVAHKRLLPTYDVFDEDRWFEPGEGAVVVEVAGTKLGLTICEDIWNDVEGVSTARRYGVNPVADVVALGAEVIVNVAASPFTLPKRDARARMLADVARHHGRPVVFVNQVGGNDDLIFDGASAIFGPDGATWARAAEFAEDFVLAKVAPGGPMRPRSESRAAIALDALALGVRDYAAKCGFKTAVLGLSGGIDSAVVAAIGARALGPANVLGVALPTRYSSPHSKKDARDLAEALGMPYREVSIDGMFQRYVDDLGPTLEALGPVPPNDVTMENIQSRIRGAVLMALSNRAGHLLLTTGNKSEVAVGYCTLYGDMCGGLAPLADVPKTFVYDLAREVNRQAGRFVIPESTLTKPPSAELKPNQTDQDTLPPYDLLDRILERYVEDARSVEEMIAEGLPEDVVRRVVRMIAVAEYKRRQMAPGLILTRKAFGPGRRVPIAQRWRG